MPVVHFTDADRQAIDGLSALRRSNDMRIFGDSWRILDRYATGELTLSGLRTQVWQDAFNIIREVAEAQDLVVLYRPASLRNVSATNYSYTRNLPYRFALLKSGEIPQGWQPIIAPPCEHGYNVLQTHCDVCAEGIACQFCGGTTLFNESLNLEVDDTRQVACQACRRYCSYEGCERFVNNSPRCDSHRGMEFGLYACQYCGLEGYPEGDTTWEQDGSGNYWCEYCWRHRPICDNCNTDEGELTPYGDDGYGEFIGFHCEACHAEIMEKIAERIVFPRETPLEPSLLEVVSLPDRPARATSLEQEMTIGMDDANVLCRELYSAALCRSSQIDGYHSSGHDSFCHVETDSSINGYELIYNRVDFSNPDEQEKAITVLGTVLASPASFDATTGTHLHVGMHGLTVADVKNLVIVYSYLEDVVYRIAAAGYEAHRSQLREGRNYAQSIKKEEWRDARHFGREFLRHAGHTDSLNLQHYYQALDNCHCGARQFTRQEDCDCNLGKLTSEWRVYNGTADPRRLRAWISLSQAMIAWSQAREIRYADHRPLSYGAPHDRDAAEERMRWILTKLPLVEAEKADIVWCLLNTALPHAFTDGEIEGMVGEYEPERELPPVPGHDFRGSERETQAATPAGAMGANYPSYIEWISDTPDEGDYYDEGSN